MTRYAVRVKGFRAGMRPRANVAETFDSWSEANKSLPRIRKRMKRIGIRGKVYISQI